MITEQILRAIPNPETKTRLTDTKQRGLACVITPAGTKTFVVRVYRAGKPRQITLGRYPEITLKEARKRASEAHAANDGGRAVETSLSIDDVFKTIYWPQRAHQLKHPKHDLSHWNRHIAPGIGRLKVAEVTPLDIQRLYADWRRSGLGAGAANPHRVVGHFFKWCVKHHLVDRSPVSTEKPVKMVPRERVLSLVEIRHLWDLHQPMIIYHHGAILRWLILTGCRSSEVISMRHSELSKDNLTIPGDRMKGGREHQVPVLPEMMELVPKQWQKCDHVFFNGRRDGHCNIGWGGKNGICSKAGLDHWTLHDLRRSLATHWAEQLRADDDLIERQLAHVRRGVVGVYNRSTRLEERREMMGRWYDLITGV